jgi:hypothetical protein
VNGELTKPVESRTEDPVTIDTGDLVLHKPTGERWIVAFVRDGRLSWCGWPEGTASLADCELIEAATDERRVRLLNEMAAMRSQDDSRCRFARWRLGVREAAEREQNPSAHVAAGVTGHD